MKALLLLLISTMVQAKTIKVAVIDTGVQNNPAVKYCNDQKDFTETSMLDLSGHGTNISGLIQRYARTADYCQIAIKYHTGIKESPNTLKTSIQAFKYAISKKVDFINYSSYGKGYDKDEAEVIKQALDQGITVVTVSGNEEINLDKNCIVFPACYDKRIVVVGRNDEHVVAMGRGTVVDIFENGYNQTVMGITLSGTSQATAITTGKLIYKRFINGKLNRN